MDQRSRGGSPHLLIGLVMVAGFAGCTPAAFAAFSSFATDPFYNGPAN